VEKKDVRILVVDDEESAADSLRLNLAEEGYSVDTAGTGGEAIELFDQGGHHLAICDLQLPDMDGLEVMRHMKDARPNTEVMVVTAHGTTPKAVEATKAGAFDFVDKPLDFEELALRVQNALKHRELIDENANLRRQMSTRSEYFNIIGSSKPMQTIYETIDAVAKSDANVLIVGESGTGKELIANAIHYKSLRARKPFIKVNCAALPKELIESELFGHTKGAFTGAHADKEGLVQHAAGGSLMLDEIAEMPVELQPKLLRVLQEQEFERLGGNRTLRVDVRVVAATNGDLAQLVAERKFRSDLYYRLNVFPIVVPPLRERREDVPLLVRYFVQTFSRRQNKIVEYIPSDVMDALVNYSWPGNIRELENLIERAVLLSPGKELRVPIGELKAASAAFSAAAGASDQSSSSITLATGSDAPATPIATLEDADRQHILRALRQTKWRIAGPGGAASLLGMKRTTLQARIRKLGIKRPV